MSELVLEGIPISEEQCIGESLPILNSAFETLCSSIIDFNSLEVVGTQAKLLQLQTTLDLLTSNIRFPTSSGVYGAAIGPSTLALPNTTGGINTTILSASTIYTNGLYYTGVASKFIANALSSITTYTQRLTSGPTRIVDDFTVEKLDDSTVHISFQQASVGINTLPDESYSLKIEDNCYIDGSLIVQSLSAKEFNITLGDIATTGRIVVVDNSPAAYIGYVKENNNSASPSKKAIVNTESGYNGGCTINSYCGQIEVPANIIPTTSSTTAPVIKVNNSYIDEADVINLTIRSIGTSNNQKKYCIPTVTRVENGYFVIMLRPLDITPLDAVSSNAKSNLTINFAVVKVSNPD